MRFGQPTRPEARPKKTINQLRDAHFAALAAQLPGTPDVVWRLLKDAYTSGAVQAHTEILRRIADDPGLSARDILNDFVREAAADRPPAGPGTNRPEATRR